jgi:hypothetical protein
MAAGVGDRHQRVVERGLDVGHAAVDDLLLAALLEDLLAACRA